MKYLLGIFVFVLFSSCEFINFQKQKDASLQPIASVYNVKLFHTDIANFFPSNITKKDSLILAKSLINSWATKQLLLKKSIDNNSLETSKEVNRDTWKLILPILSSSPLLKRIKKTPIKGRKVIMVNIGKFIN